MTDDLSKRLSEAREGAAVGPVLPCGLLRLTGKDRQDYLHRMCTQRVNGLAPGAAVHSAFLEVKGHVVAEGMIVVRPGDLLVAVDPGAAEPLRELLARFVIMDEVEVEDVSAAWRLVPALGPRGLALARARGGDATAWETPRRGAPALDVLLPPPQAETFREALVAAGATPLSEDDLEVLRVSAGVPRFGVDVDASRLVMEAGLVPTSVSFDKGCYLGQEVVLRGTYRGQIQRGLVQLLLPPGAGKGTALSAGGKEVGVVTSAVDAVDGRLGLGYLRRAHWKEGERLATPQGEAVVRRVLVQERER